MKTLIAVFSAEGRTIEIARQAAVHEGWDLFEIIPMRKYTEADIKWTNPLARCNREMLGKRDVPVKGTVKNFDEYDRVLIGFPIWYGGAPNVINTFCKGYDFSGKKVAVFATAGGNRIGKTKERLQAYVKGTNIADARLVTDADELISYADGVFQK